MMRVLFIDIDTLRPDHLGCYGYHRNTSPHIKRTRDRQMAFLKTEGAEQAPSRHAAFVGARAGELLNSPRRLRTEIRLAGLGDCRSFMFAFYDTLIARPELAQVLRDEIGAK
jgi:hypothetical protein